MATKLTMIASSIAMLMLTGTSTEAAGRHNARFRLLDDIVFSAYVDARELRWEVHDDFIDSRDYNHLLEDADIIVSAIQNLERVVLREGSSHAILREIDSVQRKLSTLAQHLNGCDFAAVRRGHHRTTHNGRGYVFTPETEHVGRIHVRTALRMIGKIENSLAHLQDEVSPRRHFHRRGPMGPEQPVIIPPHQQGPLIPPQPVPQTSGVIHGRTVRIPVGDLGSFKINF